MSSIDRSPLFEVVDETSELLVINKPGDLVCHPTKGDEYSSLISRIRIYYQDQPQIKPSFINRLDRETSGIILIAKRPGVHARFQESFSRGVANKTYLAIVQGIPSTEQGEIQGCLTRDMDSIVHVKQRVHSTGTHSYTRWRLLGSSPGFSLLEVKPRTGRLHQIRVHLSSIGLPIVGDKIYGPDPQFYLDFIHQGWTPKLAERLFTSRQMLHAVELSFPEQKLHWKTSIPSDMQDFLQSKCIPFDGNKN
jgi:23S rRNA pseudouridine1911/1915/1917 synthase